MIAKTSIAILMSAALATTAHAAGVEHKQTPNGMIAASVKVPAGTTIVWFSGGGGSPSDPNNPASLGNTEQQTFSALTNLKASLAEYGLTLGDVVKLNVFLVGDPALGGKADREGMTKSFLKFFGTPEQPNKPARTTVQVVALGRPEMFVEIEAEAAGKVK